MNRNLWSWVFGSLVLGLWLLAFGFWLLEFEIWSLALVFGLVSGIWNLEFWIWSSLDPVATAPGSDKTSVVENCTLPTAHCPLLFAVCCLLFAPYQLLIQRQLQHFACAPR